MGAGVQAVKRAREARQGVVHFEHVTDGDNTLGGVNAPAYIVQATEPVAVQPESRGRSKMQALVRGS